MPCYTEFIKSSKTKFTSIKIKNKEKAEDKKMSEMMNRINDEALENVVGGAMKVVRTGTSQNAAVRKGPGTEFKQIRSLKNGTKVNFTGTVFYSPEDDRKFAEIDYPVHGFIAASMIGLQR